MPAHSIRDEEKPLLFVAEIAVLVLSVRLTDL
jgi:hypothetical protein